MIIKPPLEIRAICHRTALYVSRNGRDFETKILNSQKGKQPKFGFLHRGNPFHQYYQQRVQFYEQGGTDDDDDNADADTQKKSKKSDDEKKSEEKDDKNDTTNKQQHQQRQVRSSAVDPVAQQLLKHRQAIAKYYKSQQTNKADSDERKDEETEEKQQPASTTPPPPPPPPLHFVNIVAPASLSLVQMELIQLVAQFTALDSVTTTSPRNNNSAISNSSQQTFLSQLVVREWNNPMYAFCQPRHGHFAYFSALVDAYKRVYQLWTLSSSSSSLNKPSALLNTGSTSAAALNDDDKNFSNKKKELNPYNNNNNSTSNHHADAIPYMAESILHCLELAAYRAEYNRNLVVRSNNSAAAAAGTTELANSSIDWHNFVVVETIEFPIDEPVELSMLPPPPTITPTTTQAVVVPDNDNTIIVDDDATEEEQVRVVSSYTPKLAADPANDANNNTMVVDPITGKSIPVNDMPEHLRIQLLDPKWAKERDIFQQRQQESNLLMDGQAVAANLARLAQARNDQNNTNNGNNNNNNDAASRKRLLDEANRTIREHAAGPSLLSTTHTTMMMMEPPVAKRPRLNAAPGVVLPPPPPAVPSQPLATAAAAAMPPPPPSFAGQVPPPPPPPPLPPTTGENSSFATTGTTTNTNDPIPEAEFVASLASPKVTLQIAVPNDASQMAWNFYGQIVPVQMAVTSTIKMVKQELSTTHLNAIPPNKIQLKNAATGAFLNKDNHTLGFYNIGPTAKLELKVKSRGGRK